MSGMRQGIEAELLLWKATYDGDTGGRLIFEISKDEIEPFFGLPTKKGGQRFAAVLVLIGDDEKVVKTPDTVLVSEVPASGVAPKGSTPKRGTGKARATVDAVREHKPRPPATEAQRAAMNGLCGLAIKWCDDEHFQEWLAFTFPDDWAVSNEKTHAKMAADVVKHLCDIEIRKALDTDPRAGEVFRVKIMHPYVECRQADGIE